MLFLLALLGGGLLALDISAQPLGDDEDAADAPQTETLLDQEAHETELQMISL
ncbi:hypothetical protein AQS8620_01777 [Aquimixticola soesokkakensis]|uniref:Uncharacterized protein n=1 Tax=Aquimixticola soesokkakensis TaxID=1519096 RepID=A0A1Y5SMR5_9RHOB|nr:hypothetical protein [Aquimixticola soesokkakensis]SLN44331.1 hypothetical protein AQS8620_01777 [Aquimixticola soesokkakensis]